MKKITLTFTILLFACIVSLSQRRLQVVSDVITNPFEVAVVGNSVYFAEYNGTTLRRYDGALTSIPYPVEGTRQGTFDSQSGGIVSYRGGLYLTLSHGSPLQDFYEFNGTDFRHFPIEVTSNIVVYQNRIYMLGMRVGVAETSKLLSYDGVEWRVSTLEGLGSHHRRLFVGGGYLYIQSGEDIVHQYSGSGIRMITGLPDDQIVEVLPVRGTENIYFRFFGRDIYFYNGTTATRITGPSENWEATGAALSGDVLYFQSADLYYEDPPCVLMRCVGAACSEVPIPEGSLIYGAEYAIYRHELYLPIRIGDTDYIYRYDGTAFTEIFEVPVTSDYGPRLSVRAAKLLIIPNQWSGNTAYEYDGTDDVITIQSPGGEWLNETHQSTSCYHTWTLRYRDESTPVYPYRHVFAIEVLYDDCTPEASVPIIPGLLQELERFTYGSYATDREWTWTGINADWVPPICLTPPCVEVPPEGIQASLIDSKGQLAYSKIFDKPFSTKFPVDDKPYTLSVSAGKDDKFNPVLLFDNDLINKGIENVSFDMYPKEGSFYLKVDTRKQEQVPISLTLRNTKGESLWQENFTAPMDKLIRAYVSKPGDYLQVSLQQKTSGVSYYPNPFKENLVIEVTEGTAPVSISLSDLNGKVTFQTKIPESGKHSINVGTQKSGLYILTIVEGELTRRELVKVE